MHLVCVEKNSARSFSTTSNVQLKSELQKMGLGYLLALYLDLQLMGLSNKILPQMVHSFPCLNIRNTYKIELKHNCLQFLKLH